MAHIKEKVPKYVAFTALDLKLSGTRPGESKWQQIVGNVVSHQQSSTSIFNAGYAVRTTDGIRVTDAGLAFLKKKGF